MEVVIRRRGGQWIIQEVDHGYVLFRKNDWSELARTIEICEFKVLGVERCGAWRERFTPYF